MKQYKKKGYVREKRRIGGKIKTIYRTQKGILLNAQGKRISHQSIKEKTLGRVVALNRKQGLYYSYGFGTMITINKAYEKKGGKRSTRVLYSEDFEIKIRRLKRVGSLNYEQRLIAYPDKYKKKSRYEQAIMTYSINQFTPATETRAKIIKYLGEYKDWENGDRVHKPRFPLISPKK